MTPARPAVAKLVLALTVLALGLLPLAGLAADIKVLAGSALDPVLGELVPKFQAQTGHRVMLDSDGAIGAMTSRVQRGEQADVVIVSRQQVDLLEREGRVVPGTRADIAKVGVGLFIRQGAPRPDIGSVDSFRRTMLAARSIGYNDPAAGAPVSIYLLGVFERLGIAAEMKSKTVVFTQRTERFAPVARGEVEIGFNQVSEIIVNPGIELLGPLPEAIQNYTQFSAGVVTGSKQADAARAFISFMASPASVALMRTRGFE